MKKQETGLKRNALEKFFTKKKVAKKLSNIFKSKINFDNSVLIEPSAGNGVWCQFFDKILAYDIEPENNKIIQQDFLKLNLDLCFHCNLHFIGNPPFGRQSKLVKKFIKKICDCKKTKSFGFILPKSFKKPSYQKSIPLSFHLTYQEDLEDKSFIINNEEYDVPCIFQIWERKSIHRDLPILLQSKGFEFVKKNNNPDYSLRRVGVYAGKIDAEIDSKSEQSHYFITLNKKDNNFIERYNHSVKFEHNNTVGAKSISKQEFIKEINKII